ncbi:sugar ABC transporter ATP-binding protein [Microbacterium sp. 18062]|uniref:sugar ABC transporter ATP-binding protein n=1 Tax=Microbacterium sp. 18062 TaxID=2681410 RepID=UPI00135AAB4E|nr:sugar ABC transporter ATP-binding protein [Microbacterium sp. 18062]
MTAADEPSTAPRLEVRGITRSFAGRRVLGPVSFAALPGEVIGLVGENGAGKSTLLNILSGVLTHDSGDILLDGEAFAPSGYRRANERGIFRVYQDSVLIPSLTVEENLLLGWEDRFTRPLGTIDGRRRRAAARRALERVGLPQRLSGARAGTLGQGTRQLLAFAKALSAIETLGTAQPIILLDEPTTSLDSAAEHRFLAVVEELRAAGATIFLVSHLLQEVLAATSRVIVLKDGSVTAQLSADQTDETELHRHMVGRERLANYYLEDRQGAHREDASAPPRLVVDGLVLPALGTSVSFDVRAGEVLGFAGLEDSGKTELGRALAGAEPAAGTVRVDGSPSTPRTTRAAIDAGIVYVPADRPELGVIREASIERNIQVGSLHDRYANRAGIVRAGVSRAAARRLIDTFGIVARGERQPVGELSGGNQQKVVLARWLSRDPSVIVLDSPTQGVDTGARAAIYREIRNAAAAGAAIVLLSEDLTEVIGLSDRVAVLRRGTIQAIIDAPAPAKPEEAEILGRMM